MNLNQTHGANSPANSTSGGSQPRIPAARTGLPTRQEIGKTQSTEGATATPSGEHLTKIGTPDRRFKGQRDLPDPVLNPNYQKPTKTMQFDAEGHLLTKDGKPDRRFKGAREMSDEEVEIAQAKWILEQKGIKVK